MGVFLEASADMDIFCCSGKGGERLAEGLKTIFDTKHVHENIALVHVPSLLGRERAQKGRKRSFGEP